MCSDEAVFPYVKHYVHGCPPVPDQLLPLDAVAVEWTWLSVCLTIGFRLSQRTWVVFHTFCHRSWSGCANLPFTRWWKDWRRRYSRNEPEQGESHRRAPMNGSLSCINGIRWALAQSKSIIMWCHKTSLVSPRLSNLYSKRRRCSSRCSFPTC